MVIVSPTEYCWESKVKYCTCMTSSSTPAHGKPFDDIRAIDITLLRSVLHTALPSLSSSTHEHHDLEQSKSKIFILIKKSFSIFVDEEVRGTDELRFICDTRVNIWFPKENGQYLGEQLWHLPIYRDAMIPAELTCSICQTQPLKNQNSWHAE